MRAGSTVRFLLVGALAVWLVAAGCSPAARPTATPAPTANGITVIHPAQTLADFTLTDQTGSPLEFADLRGKFVLMTFGYTHCPDVCPINLARFKRVKDALGEDAAQVQFVFVSVDGRRDTPERLRAHLSLFDSAFIGLTGDEAAVREVIGAFGGQFTIRDYGELRENYTVDHTASTFLVNADGQWIRTYVYETQPQVIIADIASLIQR